MRRSLLLQRMEDDREINDRHVEQYQRDIAQAKHAAQTHGMGAKARLQALEFAYVPRAPIWIMLRQYCTVVKSRSRRLTVCWTRHSKTS
jgi:hypothetical protein